MSATECEACHGRRLSPESLAVTVGGLNISEFCDMSVDKALDFINNIELTERQRMIAKLVIKEIISRLNFLKSVGLGYLTLSRRKSENPSCHSNRLITYGRSLYPR